MINYQNAILNNQLELAQKQLNDIPETYYSKLAKFLETNGQKRLAYELTPD